MSYLEKELQPCMKSKRADKRKVWFAVSLFPVLVIVKIVSHYGIGFLQNLSFILETWVCNVDVCRMPHTQIALGQGGQKCPFGVS